MISIIISCGSIVISCCMYSNLKFFLFKAYVESSELSFGVEYETDCL